MKLYNSAVNAANIANSEGRIIPPGGAEKIQEGPKTQRTIEQGPMGNNGRQS